MPFPPDPTRPEPTPPPEPLLPLPFPDAAGTPTFTAAEAAADAQVAFRRYERPWPRPARYGLHLLLFLVTLLTTTLAGVTLTDNTFLQTMLPFELLAQPLVQVWAALKPGLWYAGPFLAVLTVHEFGHYFTARYNRISSSLPYFIPLPLGFGTFGAVIRIKEQIHSRREFFDVGLAGPLAGFVVAVGVLWYGLTHLPPLEYLFQIHPELRQYGAEYGRYAYQNMPAGSVVTLGQPLLFQAMAALLADPALLPHPYELLHYPVLVAGVFSLFFTALNLLPIGQLDGGHIVYGLLGPRRAARVSILLFVAFIFYAGLGLFILNTSTDDWLTWSLPYALYLWLVLRRAVPTARRALLLGASVWLGQIALASGFPGIQGNPGWLLFGLLLARATGIFHPPAPDERPLSPGRKVLGWLMLLIFVLCFAPSPIIIQ
ncbi:site-2 protease family protein [Hymenobacter psychrophilus]|uniref:Peptidase family M50 n=1 Tax=Hymenobacter psychrophilus TaxID=651662 RepID=A0A1H3DQM3_9BACT|nr:site-2 protease family protein [Hymenobacter psychrophilus]SDX68398.1 Peptidase family M50 [Hymenobacter psychrophilus]